MAFLPDELMPRSTASFRGSGALASLLPSRLDVGGLAYSAVATASASVSELLGTAPLPPRAEMIATAYLSDRHLLIDGRPPQVWSPLSRFWRAADGWVRTHANYPHHAAALQRALRTSLDPADVGAALAVLPAKEAVDAIGAHGGLCVRVLHEDAILDERLRREPVVRVARTGDAPIRRRPAPPPAAPLTGVRVLDLTRVIAGPVCTRTLAFAGADVLRIDPPSRPEFDWQHFDTGHGKRTTLLDAAADPSRLDELLGTADVVVLGYRPDGLHALGLSPETLAARHPHLVVAQLSAWSENPALRGFDSLVQAESGISWIESPDGETPGALPAQALDHTAGYLLAAGICTALRRRSEIGGGWRVTTTLRRVAAELLGMPRTDRVSPATDAAAPRTQEFRVGEHRVVTVAPALTWQGAPDGFSAPRPWGRDRAEW